MAMHCRAFLIALPLVACGAGMPGPGTGSTPTRSTLTAPTPTRSCLEERDAIFRDIAISRERTCASDSECRVITGPRHFDSEYNEVVHAQDADALDLRSGAHLARCGATIHHEPSDVFRVVAARCGAGACLVHETVFHIDEDAYSED